VLGGWKTPPACRRFLGERSYTLPGAYRETVKRLSAVKQHYRPHGIGLTTKNVFPVLLHPFARAGFDPGVKFMKESYSPLMYAVALGAALQYDRKLMVCPDFWQATADPRFPGHSAEEYRSSLLMAYWLGARGIFTEYWTALYDPKTNGPNRRGNVLRWFTTEYVPSHPRPYKLSDAEPEVALVRFPSSAFGQPAMNYPDRLYGVKNLSSSEKNTEWLAVWKLLSHGVVDQPVLYQGNDDRLYDFFVPLNNIAVFDHRVGYECLSSAELVIATGVTLSERTLRAVRKRVRQGATAIIASRLAPKGVRSGPEKRGRWVVTDDFSSERVRRAAGPYLGKATELRYEFGNREVIFRPRQNDRTDLQVKIQKTDD
jgi:hypothetical protein